LAAELARQIANEEDRTGIRDQAHFAYSTFAKAAAQRRANLLTSVEDLRAKLAAAQREHDDAVTALKRLEPPEERERAHHKGDPRAVAGGWAGRRHLTRATTMGAAVTQLTWPAAAALGLLLAGLGGCAGGKMPTLSSLLPPASETSATETGAAPVAAPSGPIETSVIVSGTPTDVFAEVAQGALGW
jgi:hypothetical protein